MVSIELRLNENTIGHVKVVNRGPAPDFGLQRNVYLYEWTVLLDRAWGTSRQDAKGFLHHARHDGAWELSRKVLNEVAGHYELVGTGRPVEADPTPPAPWHG